MARLRCGNLHHLHSYAPTYLAPHAFQPPSAARALAAPAPLAASPFAAGIQFVVSSSCAALSSVIQPNTLQVCAAIQEKTYLFLPNKSWMLLAGARKTCSASEFSQTV